MPVTNDTTRGTIFYGLHFVSGVAEYQEPFEGRIFLNEQTLRKMDPTFSGCPVFVRHVDEVEQDIDKLRAEADGWVIESFFNKADGKHWVKFLVTSEKGEDAIRKGYRLSNSYSADKLGAAGVWNDVSYDAEVLDGNFEHLALVPVPRYNESIILTPEKYKEYCAERELEIQRIANSGSKKTMGLQLFKRTKVDNGVDIENTLVVLPKSKKEFSILQLVNAADEHAMQHGMAHPDHLVDMGEGKKMSVKDMCNAYNEMSAKMKAMENDDDKKDVKEAHDDVENDDDTADMSAPVSGGAANDSDDGDGDDSVDNAEEELAEKKAAPEKELPKAEKPKNSSGKKKTVEQTAEEAQKRAEVREKAARLRNAGAHAQPDASPVNFSLSGADRGKQRYGSGR